MRRIIAIGICAIVALSVVGCAHKSGQVTIQDRPALIVRGGSVEFELLGGGGNVAWHRKGDKEFRARQLTGAHVTAYRVKVVPMPELGCEILPDAESVEIVFLPKGGKDVEFRLDAHRTSLKVGTKEPRLKSSVNLKASGDRVLTTELSGRLHTLRTLSTKGSSNCALHRDVEIRIDPVTK